MKFPSVFRRIENYRNKVEEREKHATLVEQPISSSNKWPQILRNEMKLGEMNTKREVPRTFQDKGEFGVAGVSKLRSEEEWLDKKEDEGY